MEAKSLSLDLSLFFGHKREKALLTRFDSPITASPGSKRAMTPFLPPLLPLSPSDDHWPVSEMDAFKSATALARLDGMVSSAAKADLFWLGWLMQEAQTSNKLEGTYTTLDEILGDNVGIQVAPDRKDDVVEVLNYRDAMLAGMGYMKDGRELSLAVIKDLHAMLLKGVRGQFKFPGKFRSIQVQIGKPTVYIPPDPIHVQALMENFSQFMSRRDLNPVLQAGIGHAQFEMIHPFCDGNGRLGRLLISLYLARAEVISKPCFYISSYFHKNRTKYYDALNWISKNASWNVWIDFFMESVINKSRHNMDLLLSMSRLYDESKEKFINISGSKWSIAFLDYIFEKPIFTVPDICASSKIALKPESVSSLLARLASGGLISKAAEKQGRKPAVWEFSALLNLLETD